jgi:hypothetical protein
MTFRTLLMLAAIAAVLFSARVHAIGPVTHRIEPDDFAEAAILNDINPLVDLRIFVGGIGLSFPADIELFDPTVLTVTANEKPYLLGGYLTSTGTKTFGHAGITFFPETRQLAMRFSASTTSVTIDFIGTSITEQVGVLEVYSPAGVLLETDASSELLNKQVATLSISRPAGDIGYAKAYSHPQYSPFGTLDNLEFVTVPEPAAGLAAVMAAGLGHIVRRRRGATFHA